MNKLKVILSASMVLAFQVALAQQPATPQAPTAPATQPATATAEPAPQAPVAAPETTTGPVPETPATEPTAEAPVESVAEAPADSTAATPDSVAASVVAELVQTTIDSAPAAVPVVAEVVKKEPMNIKLHAGSKFGFGLSGFRGHKVVIGEDWQYAKSLAAAFGLSFGAVLAVELNDMISIVPELQYTVYRANTTFSQETEKALNRVYEVEVRLHAIELPVLCRYNIKNIAYAEVGPQFGFNLSSRIYTGSETNMPKDLNTFAFGPAIGGGVKLGNIQLGARGYFGILEYADKLNGYPWAFQVSATQFFF